MQTATQCEPLRHDSDCAAAACHVEAGGGGIELVVGELPRGEAGAERAGRKLLPGAGRGSAQGKSALSPCPFASR